MTRPWDWLDGFWTKFPMGPEILNDFRFSQVENDRLTRLVEALDRITTREDKRKFIWSWAASIMDMPFDPAGHRKPRAWITTQISAEAYEVLTGLPVTRVSKKVAYKKGKQETGRFAEFLGEVFGILGIKASPAGQVALLKRLWKQHSPG
jgi:hypothetical protein